MGLLGKPEVTRIGDDFAYSYGVHGIRFDLMGITNRQGFSAHLTVWAGNSPARKLSWGRLKLDSESGRSALAKLLDGKLPDFDWATALGQISDMTFTAWQEGSPTVRLVDVAAPPKPQYLIDPLLPLNETTILYGDGDAGKSTVSMALALCVALGRGMPGFSPPRRGPVLYLDWETNPETHKRRADRIAAGMNEALSPHIHYRQVLRPLGDEARMIRHEVARTRAVLVIVDSLGFGSGAGESINDSSVAVAAMNALRTLGVTRLALHHMSHESVKSPGSGSAPGGSRYYRNAARCLWEVHRSVLSPQIANVGLYNRKMNDDARLEEPLAWEIDYGEVRGGAIRFSKCELADDPALRANMALADQIGYLLQGRALAVSQLADEVDATQDSIRKALRGTGRFVQIDGTPLWGLRAPRSTPESASWVAR